MGRNNRGPGFRDFNRGSHTDRYSTYKGTSTPKRLVTRTYHGSGNTYRMNGTNNFGSGLFGKKLGKKRRGWF